jgi:hypothetical protein
MNSEIAQEPPVRFSSKVATIGQSPPMTDDVW